MPLSLRFPSRKKNEKTENIILDVSLNAVKREVHMISSSCVAAATLPQYDPISYIFIFLYSYIFPLQLVSRKNENNNNLTVHTTFFFQA